jgi:PIN domain nuclease of toxin-antitoxin system
MLDVAVTDTHALAWYAAGARRKLGRDALRLFERADAGEATVFVPTMVLVEISENVRMGRIRIEGTFHLWEEELFSSGSFVPADLTRETVRLADGLYTIPERGDRLIAAAAIERGCALVTRDPEIAAQAGLRVVW